MSDKTFKPTIHDKQRTDEVSQQRGSGETGGVKALALEEQPVPNSGYNATEEQMPEANRGILADAEADEGERILTSMSDDRHPNIPDHANSDAGPKSEAPDDAGSPHAVSNEQMKDFYGA